MENYNDFKEIIEKLKTQNIFKYGKNEEIFQKAKKLVLMINAILKELNLNSKNRI